MIDIPAAGAYADYTVCKEEWLARAPVDLLLNVAGGVPLVALTAYQVLSPSHTSSPRSTCPFSLWGWEASCLL